MNEIFKKHFTIKKVTILVVALAVIALVIIVALMEVKQNKLIKNAKASAISNIIFNTGRSNATAYLYPTSKTTTTTAASKSCGSDANGKIEVGNFSILVVKKDLGFIPATYQFSLPDMTFTPGQNKLWNGTLNKISLNLTGVSSDKLALYQYQDCDHTNAYLFDIDPNTNRLEPIQFRGADNVVNYTVITRVANTFKATGKDTMDTVVDTSDLSKPYAIIHWQFDSKDNLFKQIGKDLTATIK